MTALAPEIVTGAFTLGGIVLTGLGAFLMARQSSAAEEKRAKRAADENAAARAALSALSKRDRAEAALIAYLAAADQLWGIVRDAPEPSTELHARLDHHDLELNARCNELFILCDLGTAMAIQSHRDYIEAAATRAHRGEAEPVDFRTELGKRYNAAIVAFRNADPPRTSDGV